MNRIESHGLLPRLAPPAAALALAAGWPAHEANACTTRKLCVEFTLVLTDGATGDHVGVDSPRVPARGAHVFILRPYPEPVFTGWLNVDDVGDVGAGCIEFDSQFAAGHKALVEAQAVLDYSTGPDAGIRVRGFAEQIEDSQPSAGDLAGPIAAWEVVDMPPCPDDYSYKVDIEEDGSGVVTLFGTATETVHLLHGIGTSQLDDLHDLNLFIRAGGQNANATFAAGSGIVIGEFGGLDRKFIIGHEIGHWLQLQLAGGFGNLDLDYGPVSCDPPHDPFIPPGAMEPLGCPYNTACQFFVVGTLEGDIMPPDAVNPNRHGIRSAEFSSAAMVEGFGHFVAAAAYNDLEITGRYQYYKDIDEDNLPDYEDFETGPDARQVELAGGSATSTVGGRSRWTALECSEDVGGLNDWDHPLDTAPDDEEVSTEIDWLRLFWQYATASYSGSNPSSAPSFWDTVDLVIESQTATPSWGDAVVWPRMDDAIEDFLGSSSDWLTRWRDLSENDAGGNGVYNDGS